MASLVREQGLDKFYTNPDVSKKCIDRIGTLYPWNLWDLIIEPSAGNGSFLKQIPSDKKIGIDISPEEPSILEQDFLTYDPNPEYKNILVIGNPPFGKVSSLAVKFFNHSARWANCIAFIVPKTFRRISVQNRLNTMFHLQHDEDIPSKPCAFTPKMSVKCCFQIWRRKDIQRERVKLETVHSDWEFLKLGPLDSNGQPTPPDGADFAVRAYGGKCGEIIRDNLHTLRPKSYHWVKSNINVNDLIKRFESLDFSKGTDTARQNSIGRGEFVSLYSDKYD